MEACKRFEIIINDVDRDDVLALLEAAGVNGYTLIRDVGGKGEHGEKHADVLTDLFRNCLLVVACAPEAADRLVPELRRFLRDRGGACLVSDAHWLTL